MNPYLIIGALVAFIVTGIGGFAAGDHYGTASQKAVDQAAFDKVEAERTKQKAEANALYQHAQADIIALQAERDAFKTKLEKEHADNQKATDALRAEYAARSLRYSAQGAGYRADGSGANGAGSNAASAQPAAVLQLPNQITGDLRQLALDADRLKDDYAECYSYANQVK